MSNENTQDGKPSEEGVRPAGKKNEATYTHGSIGWTMFRTAIEMLPATLAMQGYNMADTFFVGQLHDEKPLAAMGFTFPVVMLINGEKETGGYDQLIDVTIQVQASFSLLCPPSFLVCWERCSRSLCSA